MNWNNTNEGDPAAAAGADPAAAAAAAAGQEGGQGGAASLLSQGQATDWLPEKYRTFKEGTQDLDLEASARKLSDAHRSLEQRMGQGGLVPKTAAEYKLENLGEGINVDEVRADPMFKGVLDRAHAAGVSNEALQFFMQDYFTNIAPSLFSANAQLTADEAKAELLSVWKDDSTLNKNIGLAARAAKGFAEDGDAPGSFDRVMSKFGNDPDFLAFAARIGAEMQEDTPITEGSQSATDWDSQVNAIKANPAYGDANHPQHKELHAQMTALYQKRYGSKSVQLGGSAVR